MFTRILQLPTSVHCPCILSYRNIFTTLNNLKSLKKYIDYSKVPKLKQEELEIQYVRGSGPGGQATNKTSNKVVLKHVPTGIVVKCHETRSQFKNKEIAEQLLIHKLDIHLNGEDAVENQEKRIMKKLSLEKDRKRKKLAALKAAFKEREGLK